MNKLSLVLCDVIFSGTFANENTNLNEIVVSDTSLNGVDNAKINIRNAEILRDVMREIPGVYVGGTNVLNQKIYMRGINDRGLNITIDGARQKGNAFHHSADLYIDTDIIKAVDIGLGVHSVVGNSGALGGSVAFKTVDASDLLQDGKNFGMKIKSGYFSNNKSYQQSLTTYAKIFNSLDFLGYVGYKHYQRGKSAKDEKIGGKGEDLNYLLKLGYDFNDYTRLNLSMEKFKIDGNYPLKAEWATGGETIDTKYIRDTYTLNFTSNPNAFVNLDTNFYYTDHRATTQKTEGLNAGVKTIGGKIINKTLFENGDLSQNFVYGIEQYTSQSYNKNSTIPNDKATNFSLFVEDQIRYKGFTLTPGVRYDYYTLETMGGKIDQTTKKSTGQRAKYSWNEISPALSLDYAFDKNLGIYASYAKVFRGPDPIESIRLADGNVQTMTTNDDLKPETGDSYEAGLRYQINFANDQRLGFSAKYFYNDYENLIVEMGSAGNIAVQRMNGGRAMVKGAEISARYGIGNLSLAASYSRARTTYKDSNNNVGYGGVLAYSDAGDKWTFNAEYFISPIYTLIGYNLIAFDNIATKNGKETEFKKPGYATSDIYASWTPNSGRLEGLELNFGIYNLFDKTYWSHSQRSAGSTTCRRGICGPGAIDYEPGRNIKFSVSYKF